MEVSLDQARALVAIAREGTYEKAAKSLGKTHTAVVYALKNLEAGTGLKLFDRSGYRTRLTSHGEALRASCEELLLTEERVVRRCLELGKGWEHEVRIVYDGIIDSRMIMGALATLQKRTIPTRFMVFIGHLGEVESEFLNRPCDLMISVLPSPNPALARKSLGKIRARLVAHRRHALGASRARVSLEELRRHTIVTLKGSDQRLGLPTAEIDAHSNFHVNDFHSKKTAILTGIGYGWLPDYLIEEEVRSGALKPVLSRIPNEHVFEPFLAWSEGRPPGRTASLFIKEIR